jgi:error-prone DNA polymerase
MRVQDRFRRSIPNDPRYHARLQRELQLIHKFGFENSFIQVQEILDLAPEFRSITRGSAGCSLVAYLMGIHHMDPIINNFILSRFMHENRPDKPDIDLDFAYNQRDVILELVFKKYPNRVARISNHVTYQPQSAIRQALREFGFRKFIPKHFNLEDLAGSLTPKILQRAQELVGSPKNYSLHCGGIVIFPKEIPEHLKLNNHQIKLNKDEVEDHGYFKIDLLCNRALAQLNDLSNRPLEDYPEFDQLTSKMLCDGKAWGVTFAESPAQRQLHQKVKPKSRTDITFSLALIRPAPSADGRKNLAIEKYHQNDQNMIYDDDGIVFIQKLINCTESQAELYRKAFAKKQQDKILEFTKLIQHRPDKDSILKELSYYALYSFCHAHAMSYGYLVWALAYEKTRQPKKFWWSALNHSQSMYRPWVHVQEAKQAGLKFAKFGKGPWTLENNTLYPSQTESPNNGWSQYLERGYWISNRFMPDMYFRTESGKIHFKGLIATGRHHGKDKIVTFVTIGTKTGVYHELILEGQHEFDKYDTIQGCGYFSHGSILVDHFVFEKVTAPSKQLTLFDLT